MKKILLIALLLMGYAYGQDQTIGKRTNQVKVVGKLAVDSVEYMDIAADTVLIQGPGGTIKRGKLSRLINYANCSTTKLSGDIIWVSGFNFSNTKLTYQIGCQLDTSSASNFSITAADTSDRYTIVWADTLGHLGTTDGTVGAVASIPTVDPRSQILLATYFIPANSTQPQLLSNTTVYKENTAGEWGGASNITGANFAYLTLPYQGLYSTYIPSFNSTSTEQYIYYEDGSTHSTDTTGFVSFYIRLGTAFTATNLITISFQNPSGNINYVYLRSGDFGFNGNVINDYRLVAIPTSAFTPLSSSNTFNKIVFYFNGIGGAVQLDNIILQKGGLPVSSNGVKSLNGQDGNVVISHRFNFDSTYNYTIINGVIIDSVWTGKKTLIAKTGITFSDEGQDSIGIAAIGGGSSQWTNDTTGIHFNEVSIDTSTYINGGPTVSIGGNAEASQNSALLLKRTITDGLAAHGIQDLSIYSTSATTGLRAYASFDAAAIISGNADYNHYAAFQARANYIGTGTMNQMFGFTNEFNNTGAVGLAANYYVQTPNNTGTIDNFIGLYMPTITTTGISNYYGVVSQGAGRNHFGGQTKIGRGITAYSNLTNGDLEVINDTAQELNLTSIAAGSVASPNKQILNWRGYPNLIKFQMKSLDESQDTYRGTMIMSIADNSGVLREWSRVNSDKQFLIGMTSTSDTSLFQVTGGAKIYGHLSATNLSGTNTGDNAPNSLYVPYTGATGNVDIGAYNFAATEGNFISRVRVTGADQATARVVIKNDGSAYSNSYQLTAGIVNLDQEGFSIYDTHAATTRFVINTSGNAAFGTTSPDASAKLDITSTTKGVLFPRLNTAQMNAVSSPYSGLIITNTDSLNRLFIYTGTAWKGLAFTDEGGGGGSVTTSEQKITATASQTDFTFTSVPSSYNDYMIFRNGVLLSSTTDYTTSGNIVTITFVTDLNDLITMRRTK